MGQPQIAAIARLNDLSMIVEEIQIQRSGRPFLAAFPSESSFDFEQVRQQLLGVLRTRNLNDGVDVLRLARIGPRIGPPPGRTRDDSDVSRLHGAQSVLQEFDARAERPGEIAAETDIDAHLKLQPGIEPLESLR